MVKQPDDLAMWRRLAIAGWLTAAVCIAIATVVLAWPPLCP